MSPHDNTFMAWGFGLVGLAYLAFALTLLRIGAGRVSASRAGKALFGAVCCSSLWGWLTLAGVLRDSELLGFFASMVDAGRYGLWLAFLLLLRPQKVPGAEQSLASLSKAALCMVTVVLAGQVLRYVAPEDSFLQVRGLPMMSMSLSILGLVLIEQVFRNVDPDSRWSVKPVSAALAGSFAFDLYMYSQAVIFGTVDADAQSIRGAVHALMAPLLFVSTSRLGIDWTSRLRVSRTAAFHSATLLICGVYLLFISAIGYYVKYFGGDWGRALQICIVFASLIFLLLISVSGAARAKLKIFVSKNFFRYRYDYRDEWLKFTEALCAQGTPQEMGQQVIRGLADLVESPGGGLWMKRPEASGFRQTVRLNMDAAPVTEEEDSELCSLLERDKAVVNLEEYRSFPGRYGSVALPSWLQAMPQSWLIVPLIVGDTLIGFVILLRSRTPLDANWEVHDLLKTASRQAASFLAQMVATESLLEVRKFDAFNRMSAFVVHDLKNIVTQLSLMMKNAKRLHANPEFQQDMLDTVENSLEKMRQLMAQLREGTTPAGTAFGVDLVAVVRRIEAHTVSRGRRLELRLIQPAMARGHEERIERVIGHLVLNAVEATDPQGQVWVELDTQGDRARIVVGDTGHGMSAEFIRDRLFKPFQSTKSTGMGIGAYESSQYIHELGGKISVASEPQRGTQVTVLIPLFHASVESDLDMLKSQ
ncbi:MAG: PEP-CTERM system histidine kinase PrsK [Burkholderiaceae bacterium]|nr:PEP-CTERM system histidine kinase PrsK [Burkholderiaceae bacterium]